MAALVVLIVLVVFFQIAGGRVYRGAASVGDSSRDTALRTGDLYAKFCIAWPREEFTGKAQESFEKAVPRPAAYRRLGVLKQSYGRSGVKDFDKLDSAAATRGLDKREIAELRREKAMWLRVYSPRPLTLKEARQYARQAQSLDLGPLTDLAVYHIYRNAGSQKPADRILHAARTHDQSVLIAATCLFALLVFGGFGGIAIAAAFLATSARALPLAPRSRLSWSAGLSAFLVYLASYISLSKIVTVFDEIAGPKIGQAWADSSYLLLLMASAGIAFAFGLWTLRARSERVGQDWREIGYRTVSAGRDVVRGIAGFLAALPFVFVAAMIAWGLANTVFRHVPTPEQPFGEFVTQGRFLEVALTFVAASVVAPIVEETFFRGVLYTTFRGRMGVWPAVMLSSVTFAVVHPLPGGFLPIFALACVFALMRERTGSLIPSMVCHSLYNGIELALVMLLF
jgi:membrane protease YdiL (CAAX protease family)